MMCVGHIWAAESSVSVNTRRRKSRPRGPSPRCTFTMPALPESMPPRRAMAATWVSKSGAGMSRARRQMISRSCRAAKYWKVPTRRWLAATRVSTAPGITTRTSVPPTIDAQAQNYWEYVKTKGGIHGQKIRVLVSDDGYKVDETVRLTRAALATP